MVVGFLGGFRVWWFARGSLLAGLDSFFMGGKLLSFLFFCLASGSGVVADPGAVAATVAVAVAVACGAKAGA